MDLNDDIFDSFFACIGAVKEAKVVSIKISLRYLFVLKIPKNHSEMVG